MDLPEDIFVVVAEHDHTDKAIQARGEAPPFVVETNMPATKQRAEGIARRLEANGYGETRVGRVVFGDLDQVRPVKACGALLADVDRLDQFFQDLCDADGEGIDWKTDADLSVADRDQARMILLKWVRSL